MKIKNSNYIMLLAISLCLFTSCEKDFLNVNSKAMQLETNYYTNANEAFSGLVAAYDPMGWLGTGTTTGTAQYSGIAALDAASDECYGGGNGLDAWSDFDLDAANGPQLGFWYKYFTGVSRCNVIISKLERKSIPGLSDSLKERYISEAKCLRAYYYFKLVRLFGNIPFYTNPLPVEKIYSIQQVNPGIVYRQIEKDLKEAIADPNLPDIVPKETEGGRMTKGIAHALLGKVYLYENKWDSSAEELSIVNGIPGGESKYGYHLLTNYADIFDPSNKFNSESILEITHTSARGSNWGQGSGTLLEGNTTSLFVSPRSYSGPKYVSGWGGATITPALFNALHNDPRFSTTILDLDSLVAAGVATYVPGFENTGYFIKKFVLLKEFESSAGAPALNYPQDYIEIRLAGTYLLEAEALVQGGKNIERAAALLNAVRARVGLAPEAPTLENIYREEYLELATEGHRWFNLIRTGRAEKILGPLGFKKGVNEVLPIPLQELTNTKLVQNPGY